MNINAVKKFLITVFSVCAIIPAISSATEVDLIKNKLGLFDSGLNGKCIKLKGVFVENASKLDLNKVTTKIAFTAIINPLDPKKLNFDGLYTRLRADKDEYLDEHIVVIGDGTKWLTSISEGHGTKKPGNYGTCMIESERPLYLGDPTEAYLTGQCFFTGLIPFMGTPLKETITRNMEDMQFSVDKSDGMMTWKNVNRCSIKTVSCDTETLAIKNYSETLNMCGNYLIEVIYEFSDQTNLGSMYFPRKLKRVMRKDGKETLTSKTEITSVEIIDSSEVSQSIPIDKGWTVVDMINKITYTAGRADITPIK